MLSTAAVHQGLDANQERRHPPGGETLWEESWYFDFAAAEIGGFVRLGLFPNLGIAWYWGYLVRRGEPLLVARHHEAAPPRGEVLELREDGLWAALYCETPHEHWTAGLEAFAVALDDPNDALRGERGDRVPLGFDLEWEGTGDVVATEGAGYAQPCRVSGEILVGAERLDFDGRGHRDHRWGRREWWESGWAWAAGTLDDGTAFCGRSGRSGNGASTTALTVGGLELTATPRLMATIPLQAPDGRSCRLDRALCHFTAGDGRTGYGWTEWN
ncbi:MAG: hypothetical protein KY439_11140, partial [Actinobacteria bacterium]|nr:hypothetical protein [Actinomycetota bacterium]